MNLIKSFIVTFSVFMVIDLLWLGVIAQKLYQKYLGFIMTPNINWIAAVTFYIIFVAGMLYFAILPALNDMSLQKAIINGMLYGFITYATYDLTNLATLKDWPITITVIDMIWGTTLAGLTSVISYLILK